MTRSNIEWSRLEELGCIGEARVINCAGKRVASLRRQLCEWLPRNQNAADSSATSAPSFAKARPATNDAKVAIFDSWS